MAMDKIENLQGLVSNTLKDSEKIVNTQITRLTKPGENYGSIMLKVDLTIKNQRTEEERVLNAVAKLIPENEFLLKVFNTQVTYKNELEFYRTIVPTLQQFQRDHGVQEVFSGVAKFIGGRISLDPRSEKVDKNAVIMLENLRVQGFQSLGRTFGLDLKTAKLIIYQISTFHAVPLALKQQKPKLFESNIKPYLEDFTSYVIELEKLKEYITNLVSDNDLIKKAHAALEKQSDKSVKEPWATVIQNDLWTANTLVKFDQKNEPVDARIVDFQVCEYKSPVRDLIFFLFSSVKIEVLKQHLDELLEFYYQNFINTLKQLKADTSPFTWESFNDELRLSTSMSEYFHVLWMLDFIHAVDSDVKEINDYKHEDFVKKRTLAKLHQDTILFMTEECDRRGWI